MCEGCGDCGVQSNCLSVEPLETPLGRKRTINQNTCNSDYSCLKGFCPSFVTVKGATLKKRAVAQAASPDAQAAALPEPTFAAGAEPWAMLVAGVGGTGVITIGQILGQAAHMEGKGVVTQDAAGLAQKGGATWSHIMIADQQDAIYTTRVDVAGADVILGCDPIVAANGETMQRMREGRTHVALNAHGAPTAAFVKDTDWQDPTAACLARLQAQVGTEAVSVFDADGVATKLVGDSIYTNPVVMGYAWQKGWIPLQLASIRRAFELNGVQVANNLAAFDWGRRCAHDWAAVQAMLTPAQVIAFTKTPTLDETIALRVKLLTDYQNAAYAAEYTDFVAQVRAVEQNVRGAASLPLTMAVAQQLYRLMAIKDEYEVARLHTDPVFAQRLRERFDGDLELNYHMAPPLLAKRNARGELIKQTYGPWLRHALKLVAALKGLRGTALDVFGHSAERREERALVHEYRAAIGEVLATLNTDNHGLGLEIARLPGQVRGFGHVKMRNLAAARSRWDGLMAQWRQTPAQREAA